MASKNLRKAKRLVEAAEKLPPVEKAAALHALRERFFHPFTLDSNFNKAVVAVAKLPLIKERNVKFKEIYTGLRKQGYDKKEAREITKAEVKAFFAEKQDREKQKGVLA